MQHGTLWLISGFQSKSYDERLSELGISAKRPFHRRDMISFQNIDYNEINNIFIIDHGRENKGMIRILKRRCVILK